MLIPVELVVLQRYFIPGKTFACVASLNGVLQ
jgi:hypothetical protein